MADQELPGAAPEAAVAAVEPAEHVQAGGAEGPQQKRRRAEADPAAVSPATFALRLYFCHLPVKVGRCVWCLNCFEAPGRPYQAWKQGRCGGTKPAYAMPPGLCDDIIRMPGWPDVPPAMHSRWTLLVGACR